MQGGTFTISNGGVYGSLMSTPILRRINIPPVNFHLDASA
jgi:pyruvate/2-oxoglutarate dehydrogenase complex dihydrolipoamide acyltransferase (E2) component